MPSLDFGRLAVELAVVAGVGLILNSIGLLSWGEYTVIFVLAILALHPDETMAFFNSLQQLMQP